MAGVGKLSVNPRNLGIESQVIPLSLIHVSVFTPSCMSYVENAIDGSCWQLQNGRGTVGIQLLIII